MNTRIAGQGRYAQPEREQRWLLGGLPSGLHDPVQIVDFYFPGTRLRLRRMESGTGVVHKLGQKVRTRPDSPEELKLTNLYLSEQEYDLLVQLGGAELHKTRWHGSNANRSLAVDEFQGHLAGLILAEVELSPDEAKITPPPCAVADVTEDDRFTGGTLAHMNSREARSLLGHVTSLGVGTATE
jgi:CYTH domain-containing protein